ncbi:MAG: ABC transporter ATP-binding protein [Firmicutes bacterium]|nr:ABC transporter ATP-binding protein [Bacillota bacterium]MBR3375362.1 ABC transporter ATP-binding protein [Bacillota bacterium]MBR4025192.1 ABC transporter ATP-binding protein [Bacillota bacterium]
MIRVLDVTKRFEDTLALDGLTMTVPKGSIYGLMGLNGAGKTTIIKHLAGFLKEDEGEITIDGEYVMDNEELKKRVVFIPDDLFFFRSYSMKEMAAYFSRIYPAWDQERFEAMASDFQLNTGSNIGKFSKGMKKQAAFCLAMATMPDYLILDEPVDGLDPIVRHKLWHYIMADVADREMTVLISSHNAKEMEDVCNYIGIMSHGKMVLEGDLLEMGDVSIESLFLEKLGGIKGGEIDG